MKKDSYFDLFATFFKLGAFTFGGGYAMLPLLQREVVEKKGWATNDELLDYYAVGQCTPGIIAVNTATFIGAKYKGILGGIVATLGVVAPSLVIISVIAFFLDKFSSFELVRHAFAGIRVAVSVLIVNAVIKLWKNNLKGAFAYTVFGVALILAVLTNISTVWIVLAAGASGVVFSLIKMKGAKK